jgi:hypothetical protein
MNFQEFYLNEGSDVLFHATNLDALIGMIEDNSIKFTLATGADSTVNRNKYYYLSTSRVKYGNYASGNRNTINRNVVIDLNGKAINSVAKIKSTDYWGKDFHSHGFKEEQEERILSDKPELKPLSKYVNGIYVYVPEESTGFLKKQLINISNIAPKIGVNIYFYGKGNENAFKMQRKEKAVVDVNKILIFKDNDDDELVWRISKTENDKTVLMSSYFTKKEAEDFADDLKKESIKSNFSNVEYKVIHMDDIKNYKEDSGRFVKDLENLLKVYKGEQVDIESKRRIISLVNYNEIESVMSYIRNNKSTHPKVFEDIVNEMKKVKITNVRKFIEYAFKIILDNKNK